MTEEEPEIIECYNCSIKIKEGFEYLGSDDETYCQDCFGDLFSSCNNCGEPTYNDNLRETLEGHCVCLECLSDHYSNCANCGGYAHDRNSVWSDEREATYCCECYDDIPDSNPDEKDIGRTINSTTFKQNPFKRFIGVEIEAENGDKGELIGELFERGSEWGACYDGSLDDGIEAVSPKMNGDEAFKEIKKMCELLTACGFETSSRAGVHVHFDFTKATEKEIQRIVAGYYVYEALINRMLPASRSANHYCKSIKEAYRNLPNSLLGKLDNIYRDEGDKHSRYCGLRYAGLNLHSWYYRGTLEVRTHSSTLNPQKIINWVLIHQKFFDFCLSKPLRYWLNKKPSFKEWKQIIGNKLYAYYNQRVKEFAGTKTALNRRALKQLKQERTILASSTIDEETAQLVRVLRRN